MKIGILAIISKNKGGIYQYTKSLIDAITHYTKKYDYLIIRGPNFEGEPPEGPNIIEISDKPSNLFLKIKRAIYLSSGLEFGDITANYKKTLGVNIDLIISPFISLTPLYLRIPYILVIHDFQHRYFPEFFTLKEKLSRDYIYKKASKNALLVVFESNFVKRDALSFLRIPEDKMRVIPSPPPRNRTEVSINIGKLEEIRNKYNISGKFLFYPAHFWYHKNHTKLFQSLSFLKLKYKEEIPLILVGLKKNAFENAMRTIKELKLEKQIKWLGYVPEEDMACLYKLSTALVMPTLFESLSMPIWEAFHLGIPVVSSNVCALHDQVGNAGLLFDPHNIRDIAEKIHKIWTDEHMRQGFIKKGYETVKSLTIENYAETWEELIDIAIRKNGR